METTAATLFQLDFKADVFLYLGIIYFSLFMFWLFSLRDDLFDRFQASLVEKIWIIFSILAGLSFSAVTIIDWGAPAAGTAISIGLCISLALINPSAAACLLASSLYLRPWELTDHDPYLSILPRLGIILCLSHLLLHFAAVRKIKLEWNPLASVLIAYTIWCFLSTLFAPDPAASQGEFYDGFIKSILLYLILIQIVKTKDALRLLLVTLLLSFLFVGFISIFQTVRLSSLMAEADTRLKGFGAFTNSNDIAALMVFIFPFAALAWWRKNEHLFIRAIGFILSATAFVAVILSRSRGAMMGIAAIIATYLIIRIGRKAIVPVVIGLIVLAIPAAIIVSNRSGDDLEGSSSGRKTYLKAGIRMGFSNPLFGVGFNAFPVSLATYTTESLEEKKEMTAHNSFVLVFAEMGAIGLLLFSTAFILSLLTAWKVYPTSPEFLLALVGYGVTMVFLSHSYLIYPYLLYALIQIAYRSEQEGNSA